MKKILLFVLTMMLVTVSFAQTNTWDGSTNNNWNTAANWSLNAVPTAAHDVVININAAIQVDASPTINSLTISGSATVSLTSNGAGQTITIDNNGSSIALGSTLTLQGSTGPGTRDMEIAFSGANRTMSIAGTLIVPNVGDGTVYTSTGSLTTVTGTFRNLGGTITSSAANLSFSSGGTYDHAIDGGTIPTATWNAASTCTITGNTTNAPGGLTQAFGNFTWNSTSQTADESFAGALTTVNGNLTVTSTGTGSIRLVNGPAGAALVTNVAGNFVQSAGEFYVMGTSASTGSSTLDVNGNVTITTGTFFMSGNSLIGTLNVAGNFSHTSGTITESSTGSGLIVFDGAAAQSLTGGGTVSNTINYRINNTSATGVTLATPYTIGTTLTFTDGYLYTATGTLLTISAGGTTTGASNASFVQGPIRKNGATAYSFPVGNAGIYAPLSISAPAVGTDGFTAEYFRGATPDQASRISQIGSLSTVDYWRLDRPAGSSLVNVTLSWTATSKDPGMPYGASSTVALHSALTPKWASHGRTGGTTGNATAGTVTWNAVASYNDFFAIGVSSVGATALPVNFANVNAKQINGGVLVSFSNLTESDIDFYEVERSTDGRNFTSIGKVQPKGNDYGKWDYSFTDAAPASKSYYRIKSVEFSNTTKYSVILKVSSERTANAFVVYPNPVQNKVVTLQANNITPGAYSVTIVNSNGQQVFAKTINFQAGSVSQSIELPSSVKPGMYMLRIENAGTKSVTSLFIQ